MSGRKLPSPSNTELSDDRVSLLIKELDELFAEDDAKKAREQTDKNAGGKAAKKTNTCQNGRKNTRDLPSPVPSDTSYGRLSLLIDELDQILGDDYDKKACKKDFKKSAKEDMVNRADQKEQKMENTQTVKKTVQREDNKAEQKPDKMTDKRGDKMADKIVVTRSETIDDNRAGKRGDRKAVRKEAKRVNEKADTWEDRKANRKADRWDNRKADIKENRMEDRKEYRGEGRKEDRRQDSRREHKRSDRMESKRANERADRWEDRREKRTEAKKEDRIGEMANDKTDRAEKKERTADNIAGPSRRGSSKINRLPFLETNLDWGVPLPSPFNQDPVDYQDDVDIQYLRNQRSPKRIPSEDEISMFLWELDELIEGDIYTKKQKKKTSPRRTPEGARAITRCTYTVSTGRQYSPDKENKSTTVDEQSRVSSPWSGSSYVSTISNTSSNHRSALPKSVPKVDATTATVDTTAEKTKKRTGFCRRLRQLFQRICRPFRSRTGKAWRGGKE